jgi:pimeloyl-ACP methyl ester carboxylesterase
MVVFLHGIGCSKRIYQGLWTHPRFTGIDVLAPDLLGHGDSLPGSDESFELESHAAAMLRIVLRFAPAAPRSIDLVCHSVGGAVGVILAQLLGDRLRSFLNVEGNLIGADCGLVTRRTSEASFDHFVSTLHPAMERQFREAGEDTSDFLRVDRKAYYETAQATVRWSDSGMLLERFAQLNVTKAYVYGERNRDMPILSQLGNIPAIEIARSGHSMMIDNPAGFYAAVADFLGIP